MQLARYGEAFSRESERCFRLSHTEDGTGHAQHHRVEGGDTKIEPVGGILSNPATATGRTWIRSK